MLDDLKYIHQIDTQDALGVIEKQWQQLTHTFGVEAPKNNGITNVVLSGMGGSAWPAMYVQTWPGLNVPFEVSRTYGVPKYVNNKTLFIASSYSGNTEETLSALTEAEKLGATIVVMTAGGELEQRALQAGHPLYKIPGGIQPRMSSFFFIAAFLELFGPMGLLAQEVTLHDREELSQWLSGFVAEWRADSAVANNPTKLLAQELAGTTPIIYSGPLLAPVANKMKICMNENAKNLAWWNQLPEFSHNEFIGWSSHPVEKPFSIVDIRTNLDHDRIKKRFEITERMLSGKRPAPQIVTPKGDTLPQQIFWTSMFCDFVCTYVALLNGVDPTPVDLVEKFKAALNG